MMYYVLEIKNAMVKVVLIFLKHNGLCGQAISSSQYRAETFVHM